VPQPVGSDLHVNVPLTNVSVAYLTDQDEFIADKVFPVVPVDYKSNSYCCRVFAVHKDVDDQTRAIVDRPVFNLDRDATLMVMRDLALKRELSWVTTYFATGVWSNTDQTGVNAGPGANQFLQWNQSGSTPIKDVRARIRAMQAVTGFKPNVLVLGPQVEDALTDNADIIARIQYTRPGGAFVTRDLLAQVFNVERVLVPEAIQNTAVEGASDAIGLIYGKSAFLAYAAPNAGLMTPSAGYTFAWTGYLGAGAFGNRMKKFRMEPIAADRIEGEMAYDMKVVSSDLGQFFATAVA
jgi:hypothetical protein